MQEIEISASDVQEQGSPSPIVFDHHSELFSMQNCVISTGNVQWSNDIQIDSPVSKSEETYETEILAPVSTTGTKLVAKPSVTQIIKNWALNEINAP